MRTTKSSRPPSHSTTRLDRFRLRIVVDFMRPDALPNDVIHFLAFARPVHPRAAPVRRPDKGVNTPVAGHPLHAESAAKVGLEGGLRLPVLDCIDVNSNVGRMLA